ncbi:hypothetical protein V6N11_025621 [Hibiscus sabdariffa]|uniref:Uncharacterized protein n=1 Tax=Hibiscus sabdariffa TaxID=183260 RepID=A0ABR2STX5_9ROSI
MKKTVKLKKMKGEWFMGMDGFERVVYGELKKAKYSLIPKYRSTIVHLQPFSIDIEAVIIFILFDFHSTIGMNFVNSERV